MGCRILSGTYDGTREGACYVDSVTGTAFGPLFDSADDAEEFMEWLRADTKRWANRPDIIPRPTPDPRAYHESVLRDWCYMWRQERQLANESFIADNDSSEMIDADFPCGDS